MIRGFDNLGNLIIGIPRATLLRLLEGGAAHSPRIGSDDKAPEVYLYGGDTDEAIVARLRLEYPVGPMPVEDYRSKLTDGPMEKPKG